MSSSTNGNARRATATAEPTARSARSTLSVDRAFVVQFREPPGGAWHGRVEHIASGRSLTFTSRAELLAFLSSPVPAPGGAPDGESSTN
jgi:hypothetical protein